MPPRTVKKHTKSVVSPTDDQLSNLESKKSDAIKTLASQKIFQSWVIMKSPGSRKVFLPGTKKRKLGLPRSYRSKEYDLIDVEGGSDLNMAVYLYYDQRMSLEVKTEADKKDIQRKKKTGNDSEMDGWTIGGGFGINYVAGEGVIEKRHEHLGPSPMVAGYANLNTPGQDIRILWYDAFLKDQWCEKDSWEINVEISRNEKGEFEWVVQQT